MTTVSPITAADHGDWLPLWQGYLEFYRATLDQSTTSATFARIVDDAGDIHGAIARDDAGHAVGIVHWLTHPATWTQTSYCYLEDLYVRETSRGAGAGRALIDHVTAWAKAHDAAKVYWLTAESNATARSLYDRVATRSGMIHYQIAIG